MSSVKEKHVIMKMINKLLLVLFALIVLIPSSVMAQTREEAIYVATEQIRKANKPGKYNVDLIYVSNGKTIKDTITITIVDSTKPRLSDPELPKVNTRKNVKSVETEKKKKKEKKDLLKDNSLYKFESVSKKRDLLGFEEWYYFTISTVLILFFVIPVILLSLEYRKTKTIMKDVISLIVTGVNENK